MLRRPSTRVYKKRAGRSTGFPASEARMGFRSGMGGLNGTGAESGLCRGAFMSNREEHNALHWGDHRGSGCSFGFRAGSHRSSAVAEWVSIEVCFSLRSIPSRLRNSQGGKNLNQSGKPVLMLQTSALAGGRVWAMDWNRVTALRAALAGKMSERSSISRVPLIPQWEMDPKTGNQHSGVPGS